MGLFHRGHDALVVQRAQAAQVDHFGVDVFFRQRFRRFERLVDVGAVGENRDVFSGAFRFRPADRKRFGSGIEFAFFVVEQGIFEDQYRIGVGERQQEHIVRVLHRSRGENLEAGNVRVPALQTVRMLSGKLFSGPRRRADDEGDADRSAGHVPQRRGVVHDLVECEEAEIDGHDLDDGAHSVHRGPDARPGKARFAQRGVENALGSEPFQQPFADGIAAAVAADVLTGEKDPLILFHRFLDGVVYGIAVGCFHLLPLLFGVDEAR
ncbi:MAG: hypothetical protein P8Y65_07370 [Campylobacterales bacterium]